MQVKLKPLKAFEVIGRTGRLEHLRQVGNEWNDMVELQDADGKKLILMRTTGVLVQKVSEALGDGTSDWVVISAAPGLLHKLGTHQEAEPMTACPHGTPHRWPCETCDGAKPA